MFRFTIRDVLWLTVVVGMGVGWYCDRASQQAAWRRAFRIQGELIQSHKTEALRARESEAATKIRALAPDSQTASPLP